MLWRAFLMIPLSVVHAEAAHACHPPLPPDRLPDETDLAYNRRIVAQRIDDEARWLRDRQARGLEQAAMIFVARKTNWSPPLPPEIDYVPFYDYYLPVAWLRGPRVNAHFPVRLHFDNCVSRSIGDTSRSELGDQFVFFVRDGLLSEETIIDAIAANRVTNPTLVALVAQSPQ